jgi:hypothetical protein
MPLSTLMPAPVTSRALPCASCRKLASLSAATWIECRLKARWVETGIDGMEIRMLIVSQRDA